MARILLAEDMAPARRFYRAALEAAGHVVTEVEDGPACLDHLAAGHFDLLVTDVVMPGLDGIEVIKAARSLRPNLPVIAISGGAPNLPAGAGLALSSMYGADQALLKPVSAERLIETAAKFVK